VYLGEKKDIKFGWPRGLLKQSVQGRNGNHQAGGILHRTTVLRRKFLDVYEWQELLADRARAVADDFHLGDRCGGQDGLEEPEDPGHEGRDVDEELARLKDEGIIKSWESGKLRVR
jgi:hypothetical protein